MSDPVIVGWAHTPFGKHEDKDAEALVAEVARKAIEDAGLQPADIDGVFVGMFNNGMAKQDCSAVRSRTTLHADDAL